MFIEIMEEVLDALVDTAKIFPILYLVYLLVSFFSHKKGYGFKKTSRLGPLVGSALGLIPQCGFSVVMSDLYSKRMITVGTLMAVFIATSDEAIPIMLSNPDFILPMFLLILIKFVAAVTFGFFIDFIMIRVNKRKVKPVEEVPHVHGHDHCCADNIFLDALKHAANISLFILVATITINIIIYFLGVEGMAYLFGGNIYIEILFASLAGLIPNCVASIFLVELFMSGALSFAALVAGLSVGAGVGLLVLFNKNRKNMKENILITGLLYGIGILLGVILGLIPFGY